jgi:hypothetical protein
MSLDSLYNVKIIQKPLDKVKDPSKGHFKFYYEIQMDDERHEGRKATYDARGFKLDKGHFEIVMLQLNKDHSEKGEIETLHTNTKHIKKIELEGWI